MLWLEMGDSLYMRCCFPHVHTYITRRIAVSGIAPANLQMRGHGFLKPDCSGIAPANLQIGDIDYWL